MTKEEEKLLRDPEFRYLMTCYNCALSVINTKFEVLNAEFALAHDRQPIIRVSSRLKKPESIIEKLHRYNNPITLDSFKENIEDVAGVRVVCSFLSDVYDVMNALINQDDVELLYTKDYIDHPKESGYSSLHLFVLIPIFFANEKKKMKVEVQLRTISMDTWASLEHQLRYKKSHPITKEMSAQLLECAVLSAQIDEKMDGLRRLIEENQ